jgi:hypothetical protein
MKDFKEYVENSKLLGLTEKVWTVFSEMQLEENQIVGIREFDISFMGINKNRFNIVRIRENERTEFYTDERLSVIDITVGNVANLVHELSHVVYKNTENHRKYFGEMSEYIHKFIKYNESVIEYLKKPEITKYETIIGYLCLADDDELTAKLAGFYVPHILQNEKLKEFDYDKKLKQIYNDMKEFTCSQKEIDKILAIDKVVALISKHLSDNDNGFKNPLNSNAIETLIKEINDQGAKFIRIYNWLLEN